MNDILESIRGRKSRKAGIVTADRYLRSLNGCFDGGFCPTNMLANCSNEHWEQLVKDSASKLVYTDKDMQVGEFRRDMTPNSILDFDCIITSTKKDRDGDILESSGAEIDPYCPLLWQHNSAEPIGKLVSVTNRTNKNVSGRLAIANTPLGRDAAILVEFGALRISHGFDPTEYEPLKGKDAGWHIKKFSVVEVSVVSVPSNTDAIITALSRGKLHSPLVKGWATHLKEKTPRRFKGFDLDELAQKLAERNAVVAPGEFREACTCKSHKAPQLSPTEIEELRAAGHGKNVGSCGHLISQCRCIHGGQIVNQLDRLCDRCAAEQKSTAVAAESKENAVPDAKVEEVAEVKTDTTMGAQAGDSPDGDQTMGPQVRVCPKCAYKGKPDEFKDADPDADMEAAHIAESDEDEEETKSLKSGKKLSAKNMKRLEHIKGHMEHICGLSEDEMGEHGRPVKSMCKEVHGHVSDMLEEAKKEMPQPADEGAEMYQAGYTGAKAHFLMEVSEHPEDIKGIHDYLGKLLQEHEAAEVLKLFGGAA